MANFSYSIRSHADAARAWNDSYKGRVRLGYATELHYAEHIDAYAIVHHGTAIVNYWQDGSISVLGYPSKTTVDRLQEFTPRHIRFNGHGLTSNAIHVEPAVLMTNLDTGEVQDIRLERVCFNQGSARQE